MRRFDPAARVRGGAARESGKRRPRMAVRWHEGSSCPGLDARACTWRKGGSCPGAGIAEAAATIGGMNARPLELPLSSLDELLDGFEVVSIPLNTRFRGVEHRECAYLQGPCGAGEFAPFLEYGPAEASRWLAAAIEAAYLGWPEPVRATVPVNATVPAVPAGAVAGVLARFDGCRTAKVKVAERGQNLDDDVARVAAVRDGLGADAKVRLDANGGWDVDQAVAAITRLAAFDLEYVEQPVMPVEDLARVRKTLARNGIDVLIAADESIRKADDPMRVVELEAADLAIVKVAPLGGVRAALRIADETGLPMVVSSALDSSPGMAAGVALAAALTELDHACGLGTINLLDGDVIADPLVPRDGTIDVARAAAARHLDPTCVERHRASPERQEWWRERLIASYQHLKRGA